jgi:hypothetical protein
LFPLWNLQASGKTWWSTAAPCVQSYWVKCAATSTYYSTSHTSCLGEKDAPGEPQQITHAHEGPPHHCDQICQPAVTGFSGKK